MHAAALLTTTLLLPFTFASTVPQVLADIKALDADVQHLTAAVAAYNGGLLGQTPLLADLTQVHLATRKGYTDAAALPPTTLSAADAERIIDLVKRTLAVDNPKAVDVLETKKRYFEQTKTTRVVKGGLETLLDDHLDFSREVLRRTPVELMARAQEVVDVISEALEGGIEYYS